MMDTIEITKQEFEALQKGEVYKDPNKIQIDREEYEQLMLKAGYVKYRSKFISKIDKDQISDWNRGAWICFATMIACFFNIGTAVFLAPIMFIAFLFCLAKSAKIQDRLELSDNSEPNYNVHSNNGISHHDWHWEDRLINPASIYYEKRHDS